MLLTGLIGGAVDYSYSPEIFKIFFEQSGLEADYLAYNIKKNEIAAFLEKHLHNSNFLGFNVTNPLKTRIIDHIEYLDQVSREIGAVNCIYKNAGNWIGTNTDYSAFLSTLDNIESDIRSALILGIGGAARATFFALTKKMGINTFVWARNKNTLSRFTENLGGNKWTGQKIDLVVNCTPIGTKGNTDIIPELFYNIIKSAKVYYDLVYNPPATDLFRYAKKYGIETINGLPMLIMQASLSAEKWFATKFNDKLVKQYYEKYSSIQ